MTFFQIWLGGEPPEDIKGSMEKVRDLVGPNDKYVVLSDVPIEADINIPYDDFIREVIDDDWARQLWLNHIGNVDELGGYHFNTTRSNFIRIYYASKIGDLLYLDTDVELRKKLSFDETGKPYIAEHDRAKKDVFLFYVNNRIDYFKNLLEMADDYHIKIGTFFFLINNVFDRKESLPIPSEFFEHKSQNLKLLKDIRSKIENTQCHIM